MNYVNRPSHLPRPHPVEPFKRRFLSNTKMTASDVEEALDLTTEQLSIGTLMAPPICGLMEPLKIVILALKQGDYFSLFAPRPVCSFVSRNLR